MAFYVVCDYETFGQIQNDGTVARWTTGRMKHWSFSHLVVIRIDPEEDMGATMQAVGSIPGATVISDVDKEPLPHNVLPAELAFANDATVKDLRAALARRS